LEPSANGTALDAYPEFHHHIPLFLRLRYSQISKNEAKPFRLYRPVTAGFAKRIKEAGKTGGFESEGEMCESRSFLRRGMWLVATVPFAVGSLKHHKNES
jgi:hypothetical protein